MQPRKSLQSLLTLCDIIDCSPPGSSVHGMLQARILEWVAMPSSRNSPDPRIKPISLPRLSAGRRESGSQGPWLGEAGTMISAKCCGRGHS